MTGHLITLLLVSAVVILAAVRGPVMPASKGGMRESGDIPA